MGSRPRPEVILKPGMVRPAGLCFGLIPDAGPVSQPSTSTAPPDSARGISRVLSPHTSWRERMIAETAFRFGHARNERRP